MEECISRLRTEGLEVQAEIGKGSTETLNRKPRRMDFGEVSRNVESWITKT